MRIRSVVVVGASALSLVVGWGPSAAEDQPRLAGTVVDASGRPLPGAVIEGQDWEVPADAEGRFELLLPRGQRRLLVRSPGYASTDTYGDAPEGARIVLDREAQIAGQLIDGVSKAPIAGARILLDGGASGQARTDAAGGFRLSGLRAGSYRLKAVAPGRTAHGAESMEVEAGDEVKVLLEAQPAFTVEAEVTVEASGRPCTKPYVVLRGALDLEETRGDPQGHVFFSGVAPGTYAVDVYCKDDGLLHLPRLEVGGESPPVHRWVIPRGRQLRGRLQDGAGQALAQSPVYYAVLGIDSHRGSMTVTDDLGAFVLRGVGREAIELTALIDGAHTSTGVRGGTSDVEGLVLVPPVVRLSTGTPAAQLEGVLASADGRAMGATELHITDMHGFSRQRSVRTDAAGRFSLPVDPGAFEVTLSGRLPFVLASTGERTVESWARPGAVTRLYLLAARAGQRIHGRVLGTDGAPLADALVFAVPERDGPAFSGVREGWVRPTARAQTDQAGAFVLSGLAEGAYRLRASAGRGARGPAVMREVTAPGTALLSAAAWGTVSGQVLGLDPAHPRFVVVAKSEAFEWSKRLESRDAGGHFSMTGVPAGKVSLTVRSLIAGAQGVFDVAPGAADGPVLRLSPLGQLRVRVTDERGRPQPSCHLTMEGDLDPRFGQTDLDGEIVYEAVGPGPHEVEVSCVGEAPGPEVLCADTAYLDLPPSGHYEPLTIRLPTRRHEDGLLDRAGLAFRGNRVSAVRAGGPAMKAGLRVGDEVVEIDGFDVGARPRLIECLLAPGVPLTLKRGLRTSTGGP